ncbi:MAG: flagellar basal body P-ring formation protein FlgA [Deltaproteobacteria bacterium]|nr:flagellar basal body P-ring formation protein FlgA [Deltaproteobacteria bacterium]
MKTTHTILLFLFVLFLVVIMTFSVPLRAEEVLHVALKDRVVMNKDILKIRDIVDSNGTDVDFIRRYGDIKVSDDKDSFDDVDRSKLYSLLHHSGADLDGLNVRMAKGVHIERGQALDLSQDTHSKIIQVIAAAFNIPAADIRITRSRILPRVDTESLSSLYFKSVTPQDLSSMDNTKLKVVVENIDGIESEHTLYLKMQVETNVLVLKDDLEPGTTLTGEHFVEGRQKIQKLEGKIVRGGDLKNKTFKLVQKAGRDQLLIDSMIRKSVLVGDGALVTLSYKTPYLNISTQGKIRGTAEIGQVVRVENIDSARIVSGRLISPDLVEVIND